MIIKQSMRDNAVKITKIVETESGRLVVKSRRPTANNELRLASKALYILFEREVHNFCLLELSSPGFELEANLSKWSKVVTFAKYQSLRIILNYVNMRSTVEDIKKSILEHAERLVPLLKMKNLQVVVLVSSFTLQLEWSRFEPDTLQYFLLRKFALATNGAPELRTVRIWLASISCTTGRLYSLSKSTQHKTDNGWRMKGQTIKSTSTFRGLCSRSRRIRRESNIGFE